MKRSKKFLFFCVLILTSLSCSFTNRVQFNQLSDRVFGSKDSNTSSPDTLPEEFLEDTLRWNCRENDLKEYLGDSWENYPTDLQDLALDVTSKGNNLNYTLSFSDTEKLLVQKDPDSWAPPGATEVPDGEYDIVTTFHAYGSARLGDIFSGTVNVDYEVTSYLPTTMVNAGSLGYVTAGFQDPIMGTLEFCFDVIEDEIWNITSPEYLREFCHWPGYSFTCTPAR